jgi:hypothetical protein
MYENDDFNPAYDVINNDIENETIKTLNTTDYRIMLEETKKKDKGYNIIYRYIPNEDGDLEKKKLEIYTTSCVGSRIRDAETGEYYPYLMGSKDEYLFYGVILATGELKSVNGSNVIFYQSPYHYMNHLNKQLSDNEIKNWEKRRDERLNYLKLLQENKVSKSIIVK